MAARGRVGRRYQKKKKKGCKRIKKIQADAGGFHFNPLNSLVKPVDFSLLCSFIFCIDDFTLS